MSFLNNSRYKGLSLAEMLITMTLISIIFIMSAPLIVMYKNKNGRDLSAVNCILNEAGNVTSNACIQAIANCKYNRQSACKNLMYYADNGTEPEKSAARGVLKATCDQEGKEACKCLLDMCKDNSALCDIAGSDNDAHYYLNLLLNSTNVGRFKISDIAKNYYSYGYSNIVSQADTIATGLTCCTDASPVACIVKGLSICIPTDPWKKFYDANATDIGQGIALGSGGNVYVAGKTYNSYYNMMILKLDSDGNIIWNRRIDSTTGQDHDVAYSIVLDSNENTYIAGYSYNTADVDDVIAILKLNSDGNVLWNKRLSSDFVQTAYDIVLDHTGSNIYVAGYMFTAGNVDSTDLVVLKVSSAGNVLWQKRYNNTSYANTQDYAFNVNIDTTGNIYVTGYTYIGTYTGRDAILLKLNPAGNVIWGKGINTADDKTDVGECVKIYNGNIYYAIKPSDGSDWQLGVVKLNLDGNILWGARYGTTGLDYSLWNMAIDNTGSMYLTGYVSNATNDLFLVKLNSSGVKQWDVTQDHDSKSDHGYGIAAGNDGYVYVVGDIYGGLTSWYDICVLKIQSDQTSQNILSVVNTAYSTNQTGWSVTDLNFTESSPYTNVTNATINIGGNIYPGLE
ncbi:MAG: hypothetical protein ACD_20C00262G0001 [uncultured bacterium]|nr:MAG: hypothetical protein ACD_20C00262G0001 [uncultured bacterium]HBH18073.1 hypothetical protein [Cyanobacteria bacterium UBA9579]